MSDHNVPHETRLSVCLSGPLADHANWQVESALYSSHSEYIRDLVRRDMMNDPETDAMRRQIVEAYGQLGAGDFSEVPMGDIWDQALRNLRAKGHKIPDDGR